MGFYYHHGNANWKKTKATCGAQGYMINEPLRVSCRKCLEKIIEDNKLVKYTIIKAKKRLKEIEGE